jgi:hypothetical protein
MDDARLWEAFSTATLPEAEWTHRAHLRVAWLFLKRHPIDDAHVLLRVGIIRLNAFHGLVETTSRGYHETLTRAWLALVASYMSRVEAPSSEKFLDAVGHELGKDAVSAHYTKERITSVRARALFVEPDRAPLP